MRYSDLEKAFNFRLGQKKSFQLLNDQREVVHTLGQGNTQTKSGYDQNGNEYFGWICFAETISPGQYFLVYKSKKIKREIPLYVFEQWQTEIFIGIKDEPVFGTSKISIEHGGFNAFSDENLKLALIQKMYNGLYVLPEELKNSAASGKWNNPMLGILAAYMYLLTSEYKDDRLFKTMLGNLQNRILNSQTAPDLVALRLLGAMHFKTAEPQLTLTASCMVAAGMAFALKRSIENSSLIPKGSLVEKVFPVMQSDSIWTSYVPQTIKRSSNDIVGTERLISRLASVSMLKIIDQPLKFKNTSFPSYNPDKDWVTTSIFSQLSGGTQTVTIHDLASQLQVTTNTVKSSLEKMKKIDRLNIMAPRILGDIDQNELNKKIVKVSNDVKEMLS